MALMISLLVFMHCFDLENSVISNILENEAGNKLNSNNRII